MAKKETKYRVFGLRNDDYSIPSYSEREPGDPIRKIGFVSIDRSVFKHSKKEKEILKLAKLQAKLEDLKR